jgi:hypothetical protein
MIFVMSKKARFSIGKILATATILCMFVLLLPSRISAQNYSLNIANAFSIDGGSAPEGSTISFKDGKYILSHEPYDKDAVGVISIVPDIEYQNNTALQGTVPLITSGTGHVRVSAKNGAIQQGDPLTTSDIPGVAIKATKTGFIIGRAEESFDPSDGSEEKNIIVTLDVKFAFSDQSPLSEQIGDRLQTMVNINLAAALNNPILAFRYTLATIEIILVCGFAFVTFGRVAMEGITAVGRNPMARKEIAIGMIFNVLVGITIAIIGCGVGYFIVSYK